jgi:hypothetical protein
MCQDMPRMPDFAPFIPEFLGALSFTGLIGQPNNFLDNLIDLGCPNDYKIFLGVSNTDTSYNIFT